MKPRAEESPPPTIRPISKRPLLLAAAAAAIVLGLASPAPATNARALSLLAEGAAHAQTRQYTLAERRLQAALRADPRLAEAHRWLARIYREQGLREEALSALAHAVLIEPGDDASRSAIADLLEGPFPRWLDRETVAALPVAFAEMEVKLTDPRLLQADPAAPPCLRTAASLAREGAAPGRRTRCDRALYGFVLQGDSDRWRLRFRLHYPSPRLSGFDADYGPLAADCLELLLYTQVVAEAYLGRARRQVPVVDVWLDEQGAPGGEAWSHHLLIYGLRDERPPGEWVRQLTHEFGHLALPGIDHYREPEAWANGPLGERLFTKWLLANPQNRLRLLDGITPAHHARQRIAPLIRHFLAHGPASPLARDTSAQAMDWYLGLALYLEAALGPSALRDAMAATRTTRAETFLRAVERVMAQRAERGMALDAASGAAHLWVYLPEGRWRVGEREAGGGWQRIAAPPQAETPLLVRRAGPAEVTLR